MIQVSTSERLTAAGAAAAVGRVAAAAHDPATLFEAIYNAYKPFLRSVAVRKFGIARDDAESLVHDVFVTYLSNPSKPRDLHKYLIGAICNASRQHKRRDMKERALFCDGPVCAATPSDEVVDGVVGRLVLRASLARLGKSCRDTVERFCFKGESGPAIAQSRNTTANYIYRLVTFCRNRLKVIYAEMRQAA